MCGICGLVHRNADRALVETMAATLAHRGPDDRGVWMSPDGHVGLGHRRLSIIDLSPAGRQPMSDADGRHWIVYNGEIYNHGDLRGELAARGHAFRSACDTEAVLEAYRAWDTDCLGHLNGMFAFGLYDVRRRRLFLARDRAGEKPLYYRHEAGRFAFASELKALMADPSLERRLDHAALESYLAFGFVPGGQCLLEGVRKLPPGHALTYDLDGDRLSVWRYWRLPETGGGHADALELAAELERLLEDAVRRQLVADVPVGILLSGGLDSSLVAALAARASSKPVRTFTITFPGQPYDEGPYARLIAGHFGTEHTELPAEPSSVELLPELARQFDEPLADSSIVPTFLVSRLIRRHATVALGGDGGDELFGGYLHHAWARQQEIVRGLLPRALRRCAASALDRLLPVGVKGRNYLMGFCKDLPQSLPHHHMFFDARARRELLAPLGDQPPVEPSPEAWMAGLCPDRPSAVDRATATDFHGFLADDVLVKVDRASMAASLEVRAPWLDYRVIEFAFGRTPDWLRANATQRKILPRLLAKRLLPPAFDAKRKQGFALPLQQWFSGKWGQYLENVVRGAQPGLFDPKSVEDLLQAQRQGRMHSHRLFALAMLELWRKCYGVGLPR